MLTILAGVKMCWFSFSGADIPEHSKVNPSKVYNWFANRRKDANRKKRMGKSESVG